MLGTSPVRLREQAQPFVRHETRHERKRVSQRRHSLPAAVQQLGRLGVQGFKAQRSCDLRPLCCAFQYLILSLARSSRTSDSAVF